MECASYPHTPYLHLYLYVCFVSYIARQVRNVCYITDMSELTKKAMGRIRRKLTRVIGLYETACGYDENLAKADGARWDLEYEIESAIGSAERRAVLTATPKNPTPIAEDK